MTNNLFAQAWWQGRHRNARNKPEICLHHWQSVVETNPFEGHAIHRSVKMRLKEHPQHHNN
jgi:hypothetical protein